MADKVKLSKDGNSIDFVQSESIPTSLKKFRQSPEIEGFYRFIYENDLQKEAYEILEKIVLERKAKKLKEKQDAAPAKKAEQAAKINKEITKETVKDAVKTSGKEANKAISGLKTAVSSKSIAKISPKVAPIKAITAKATKPVAKASGKKATLKPAPKSANKSSTKTVGKKKK